MPGASHLGRMITAVELSEQLGGQLSPHTLRKLARQARIPGAVRIGHKVLFDSRSASWLVQDLSVRMRYDNLPAKVFEGDVA